jgi:hypothetical protein
MWLSCKHASRLSVDAFRLPSPAEYGGQLGPGSASILGANLSAARHHARVIPCCSYTILPSPPPAVYGTTINLPSSRTRATVGEIPRLPDTTILHDQCAALRSSLLSRLRTKTIYPHIAIQPANRNPWRETPRTFSSGRYSRCGIRVCIQYIETAQDIVSERLYKFVLYTAVVVFFQPCFDSGGWVTHVD